MSCQWIDKGEDGGGRIQKRGVLAGCGGLFEVYGEIPGQARYDGALGRGGRGREAVTNDLQESEDYGRV